MLPRNLLAAFCLALSENVSHTHARTPPDTDQPQQQQQKILSHDTRPSCPPHQYTTTLISHSPLAIYIPHFLTPTELAHLQSTPASYFTRSSISDSTGAQYSNASTRTSRSTSLSAASDPVVYCILERARRFQSLGLARENVEPLQLVRYGAGDEYHEHTDWFTSETQTTAEMGGNRVSSFFVYVDVSEDIVGGGTRFPFLDAPGVVGGPRGGGGEALGTGLFGRPGAMDGEAEEDWCKWVDCGEPWENGVTFRPVLGSAVFWVNLLKGGKGDDRTVHAGLPVLRGRKMGMNIWTREGRMHGRFRGEE